MANFNAAEDFNRKNDNARRFQSGDKLGSNSKQKSIPKMITQLNQYKNKAERWQTMAQCECTHKMDNRAMIRIAGTNNGGAPTKFKCTLCGKEFSLEKRDQAVFNEAFDLIDQACDMMKMIANTNTSDKALSFIIDFQKSNYTMRDYYKTMMANVGKANNNKHKSSSSGTVTMTDSNWR